MNDLKIIEQREVLGKDFKIYGDIENPLFLAKDVAEWIEYEGRTGQMLNSIDDDEKLTHKLYASGQNRKMWFLREEGLYEVLMQSHKPIAKEFKKKVKEILKIIRKTGGYVAEDREEEFINIYFPRFSEETKLTMIHDLRNQNIVLKSENETLSVENNLLSAQTMSWNGRPLINALVRSYASKVCYNNFGEAWNTYKKELLYKHGINLNSRITAYLNKTGKTNKPKTLNMIDDDEIAYAVSVAVAMCKNQDVKIDKLIKKYNVELTENKLIAS